VGSPREAYDERVSENVLKAAEKIIEYVRRFLS